MRRFWGLNSRDLFRRQAFGQSRTAMRHHDVGALFFKSGLSDRRQTFRRGVAISSHGRAMIDVANATEIGTVDVPPISAVGGAPDGR